MTEPTMATKKTTTRTCQDGEDQTTFPKDDAEELDAVGGATGGGLPDDEVGGTMLTRALSLTVSNGGTIRGGGELESHLTSLLRTQQQRDETRDRKQQAPELRLRNLRHQFGQLQQELQLDRLERGSFGAPSPDCNAAPPPGDSRERQPSLAAGSLGDPMDLRERQPTWRLVLLRFLMTRGLSLLHHNIHHRSTQPQRERRH